MFPHHSHYLISILAGLIAAAAVMFTSLAMAVDRLQLF